MDNSSQNIPLLEQCEIKEFSGLNNLGMRRAGYGRVRQSPSDSVRRGPVKFGSRASTPSGTKPAGRVPAGTEKRPGSRFLSRCRETAKNLRERSQLFEASQFPRNINKLRRVHDQIKG